MTDKSKRKTIDGIIRNFAASYRDAYSALIGGIGGGLVAQGGSPAFVAGSIMLLIAMSLAFRMIGKMVRMNMSDNRTTPQQLDDIEECLEELKYIINDDNSSDDGGANEDSTLAQKDRQDELILGSEED